MIDVFLVGFVFFTLGYAVREWRAIDREVVHQDIRRALVDALEKLDNAYLQIELMDLRDEAGPL